MTTPGPPLGGHLLDVNGTRLACTVTGPSPAATQLPGALEPPVVLLHGMGASAQGWASFVEAATAQGRTTVALDLRGHGRSARPGSYPLAAFVADVAGVLDALGLGTVDVVSHSLGSRTALALAMAAPHRLRRLVVEDFPVPPAGAAQPRGSASTLFGFPRKLLGAFRGFDATMARDVQAEMRRSDQGWWIDVARVRVPTLIVAGGRTSHIDQEGLTRLAAVMPMARLETVPAGHQVHIAKPTEFAALVMPFITDPRTADFGFAPGGTGGPGPGAPGTYRSS